MLKAKPNKTRKNRQSKQGTGKIPKREDGRYLNITAMATRYLQDQYFAELEKAVEKQSQSDRTRLVPNEIALLEVMKRGPKIIGSRDKFILWLNHSSIPLGRKVPLKLLLSNKAQMILDELGRIEHGTCV